MKFDRYLKSEDEYIAAMEELEKLFGAEPGTPEEDKLEFLSDIVAKYETDYFPEELPTLAEAIDVAKEEHDLDSDKKLASFLGISPSYLNMIKRGERQASTRIVRLLHSKLNIPYEIIYGEPGLKISETMLDKMKKGEDEVSRQKVERIPFSHSVS